MSAPRPLTPDEVLDLLKEQFALYSASAITGYVESGARTRDDVYPGFRIMAVEPAITVTIHINGGAP